MKPEEQQIAVSVLDLETRRDYQDRAVIGNREAVPLMPHTLIVVPPNSPFRIEVEGSNGFTGLRSVKGEPRTASSGFMRRVAGDVPATLRRLNRQDGVFPIVAAKPGVQRIA